MRQCPVLDKNCELTDLETPFLFQKTDRYYITNLHPNIIKTILRS